jgi:hypothetical protein
MFTGKVDFFKGLTNGCMTYSLLSAYGIQLNPTCRESIILSLENDGGFLYPLIDK